MKKQKIVIVLSFLAAVILSGSCNAPQPKAQSSLEEARTAIAASNDIYFQAFVKGDSSIFIDR
ncbi:MAG TPA: hypothetical protein VE035_06895, partial [Puia sp.]|nr:hypothetical protein [Puia sp.]